MADKTLPELPQATRFQDDDVLWDVRSSDSPPDYKITSQTVFRELKYWLNAGKSWLPNTGIPSVIWKSVCYGNGVYVAVGSAAGSGNIMISTDALSWTKINHPAMRIENWNAITFANGLFVAVGANGANATSQNGSVWTVGTYIGSTLLSVCYGNGLFVAVGSGTTRIAISSNGVNWSSATSPAAITWTSVCWGAGQFLAVSSAAVVGQVITSPDGVAWTLQSTAAVLPNPLQSVCYGNGIYVAVANSGAAGTRLIFSYNGVGWGNGAGAPDISWASVCYYNGLFVACAITGTANRIMVSSNGIAWTSITTSDDNDWRCISFGNGKFVSVCSSGATSNRVMTSDTSAVTIIP